MNNQTKKAYSEMEKTIEAKKKELETVRKAMRQADPEELAELEVKAARLTGMIEAMQSSLELLAKEATPLPAQDVLTARLNKYIDECREAEQKAVKAVTDCQKKIAELQTDIDQAILDGDHKKLEDKTVELDAQKRLLPHLKEAKERVKSGVSIPEGAIVNEWEKICEEYKEEFYIRLQICEQLAAEYLKASKELYDMNAVLANVRTNFRKIGTQYGNDDYLLYPIITKGLKDNDVMFFNMADIRGLLGLVNGGRGI